MQPVRVQAKDAGDPDTESPPTSAQSTKEQTFPKATNWEDAASTAAALVKIRHVISGNGDILTW